ncbi:MAG: beta-lactamase family protein [Anaerolineae bacterium]|nr:beta-lactamase family protein [Anaerolineae bacterium]
MHIVIPESVGFSSARLARISAAMQRYVDAGKIAGLITTVAHCGQTVHLATLGQMDREAGKEMQFDTIFRIASMTKPVTAVAIMMLYEEGYFTLNTPVFEFIPGFKDLKVFVRETPDGVELADLVRPVTFRHLFTHTAGLSYGWNPDDPVDRLYQKQREEAGTPEEQSTVKDMVEGLTRLPLAFQPGTKWRYSLAIDVLGHIIEIISGKPLDEFFKERLFGPLGMVDTDFWLPREKAGRLAALYGHSNDSPDLKLLEAPADSPRFDKPAFLSGGGGLLSTVADYARFLQMLTNGGELNGARLLSPTTVDLFTINQAPAAALPYGFAQGEDLFHMGYGYSLGTRVLMDVAASGKAGSLGEFGWDGAFNTYCWVDRKQALYGLLMTQHNPNNYYPLADMFKQLTYQALVK